MTTPAAATAGRWRVVREAVDENGWGRLPEILDAATCRDLIEIFEQDRRFRKTISMDRHRYGSGVYRYFAYPLPRVVAELRRRFYRRLAPLANQWMDKLGRSERYPSSLPAFIERCHAAGQLRPTPLILRYDTGGYNRLHQDLYGDLSFPLQVVIPLSQLGEDYEGGELTFTEHVARMQSRATVVTPARGEAVIFANADRPVAGARGFRKATFRHGASTVTRGRRYALGLIFHDSQ